MCPLNVRLSAEGNFEVEGKKKSLFPAGPVIIKCFVIPANSKLEKKNPAEKSFVLRRLAHKFAAVSKITCESKVHVVVSLESL